MSVDLSSTTAPRTGLGRWPTSKRSMGFGFMIPITERSAFGNGLRFADMVEMVRTAEEVGFDTVWLADHFIFRAPVTAEGEENGPWEAFTIAAALAQATTKINIGLLVSCLGWRNPGLVAKMTETIDEVSQGRFILGVGAGWHEPEYDAFGYPFDHRVSRFEDAITIIDSLLRTGTSTHDGRFFQTTNAVNRPRGPLGAEGGSPILVGTSGERMLRLTARYADAWNSGWQKEAAQTVPLLAALDAACEEVGRDPKTLIRTGGSNIARPGYTGFRGNAAEGNDDQIAEGIVAFRDLGFKHFVAGLDPCTPAVLEGFAKVIEKVDASGT